MPQREAERYRFALGVGLLLVVLLAWAMSAPPGDGPDEASHYTRMVGLAAGSLFGAPVPDDADIPTAFTNPGTPEQRARINRESGEYEIAGHDRLLDPCNATDGSRPFDCRSDVADQIHRSRSFHAKTLPTSYLLPALLSTAGRSAGEKSALGRLGYIVQNVSLLAVAAWAARPFLVRRPVPVAMVMLAFTPAALYFMAVISPSGTELASTTAFAMCLVRAIRQPTRPWVVAAVATGMWTAISRDLGVFDVIAASLVVAVGYREQVASAWQSARRPFVTFWLCLTPALMFAAAWRLWVQAPSGAPELSTAAVRDFLRHIPSLSVFTIGRIGWLVTHTALIVGGLWLLVASVVCRAALRSAPRRLATIVSGVSSWLALNALLEATLRPTGFGVQARFGLPIAVATLAITATLPDEHATNDSRDRRLLAMCASLSSLGLLASMVTMVWRHTRGLWNGLPFIDPAWNPLIGWPATWLLVAIAATAPIVIARLATRPAHSPIAA